MMIVILAPCLCLKSVPKARTEETLLRMVKRSGDEELYKERSSTRPRRFVHTSSKQHPRSL